MVVRVVIRRAPYFSVGPTAPGLCGRDLEQLLNFFSMARQHWKKVCTTNAIERAIREVCRPSRPIPPL